MVKVCKRHANNPVKIYHQCVGCELEWLREELEQKQQEIERLKKEAEQREKLIECLRFYERLACGREVNAHLENVISELEERAKMLKDDYELDGYNELVFAITKLKVVRCNVHLSEARRATSGLHLGAGC